MKRRKTHDEFKKEVFDLVKEEYEVVSPYVHSNAKIKIKHNKCDITYKVLPSSFLSGKRCPNCCHNKKKTTESFKKEVFNLVKNEFIVIGEYINSKTNIKMKHTVCGNEYIVKPFNFLLG